MYNWLNRVRIRYMKNWSFFLISPFIWLLENFDLIEGIVNIILKFWKNSCDFVSWFLTIKHQGSKDFQKKLKYETPYWWSPAKSIFFTCIAHSYFWAKNVLEKELSSCFNLTFKVSNLNLGVTKIFFCKNFNFTRKS